MMFEKQFLFYLIFLQFFVELVQNMSFFKFNTIQDIYNSECDIVKSTIFVGRVFLFFQSR